MKMPDKDYPFADMRLPAQPQIDNAPGWTEVIYAFLTMLAIVFVVIEAMLL